MVLGFTPQICTVPSGSSLQDTCYSQLKRRPSGPCNMWTIQQHILCLLPYFLWDFKNIFKCCMLWYPEFVLTVQSKNRNNFILDDPIRRDRECTGQGQRPTAPNTQNSRTLVVTWRDPPIYYICNREKTIEKSTVCPRCQVTKKLPILWSQTKTHLYWITLDHLP